MIYGLAILFFLAILCLKLKDNFEKWKIGKSVNHSKEWKWNAIGLTATTGVLLVVKSPAPLFYSIPVVLLMIAFWFWFLFDGLYNVVRKKYSEKQGWKLVRGQYDFWYTGTNDKDDAVSDNFLQRLKPWQHKLIKIGGVLLFTLTYIFIK